MSSEIIYHQAITRLPADISTHAEDLYLHLVQQGSSNCYESDYRRPHGVGRRARAWGLMSMGTHRQVLNTAIYIAGDCEGGMLKLGSATAASSPEQHIRKARRLLLEASQLDLRDGIVYKGYPIRVTLKAWNRITDKDDFFEINHPGEFKEFLALHSDVFENEVVLASNMAKVQGPEMR